MGRRKGGRYRRGVGMSIMTHASGAGGFLLEHSTAIITLDEDGSAHLTVSPCEMGQGILGVLGQIAAESMGLRYEDIQIVTGRYRRHAVRHRDSRQPVHLRHRQRRRGCGTTGQGDGLGASGRQARDEASDALDVRDGQVYVKADPRTRVSVAEISHDAIYDYGLDGRHISATGKHQGVIHCPNFQAGFAEIEVDIETGVIKVIKLVVAHDIGRAINPAHGRRMPGGWGLPGYRLRLDRGPRHRPQTGRVLTDSFATYKMHSTLDMPEVEVILVEEPDPSRSVRGQGRRRDGDHQCCTVDRQRPLRRGGREDPFTPDVAGEGPRSAEGAESLGGVEETLRM